MKVNIFTGLIAAMFSVVGVCQEQIETKQTISIGAVSSDGSGAPTAFFMSSDGAGSFSMAMPMTVGGGFIGSDPFSLLMSPEIQEELSVIGSQREQIEKLQQDYSKRIQEHFESLRSGNFNPEEASKIGDVIRKLQEQQRQDITDLLRPHQRERLDQLAIQSKMRAGAAGALAEKAIMEELGISEEQVEKLKKRSKELAAELEEKIAKLREETQESLLKELTREQREKLERMIGDKFSFPSNRVQRTMRTRNSDQE